jgi:vancomycin resistance protein YoaR
MSRVLIVLTIVLLASVIVLGWSLGPGLDQRILPGVWVWDVHLGGMTQEEAASHLTTALSLHQPDFVILGPEGQRWAFSPADLGMAVDVEATLARAYAVGHTEGRASLSDRLDVMMRGERLSPVLAWNPRPARSRLRDIAEQVDRPAQDARVRHDGMDLRLETGEVGRRMEVTATLALLRPHLHALDPTEVVPVFTQLPPQIGDDAAAQALGMARTILSEPLTLLVPDPQEEDPGPWTVPPDVMAGMLTVDIDAETVWVGLDEAELAQFLGPLAMALFRVPVNAKFRFEVDSLELVPTFPSRPGRELDVSASIERINARLQTGEHFVPLVLHEIPVTLPDTTTAEDLGIRELVAVGESYFTGSSSARDKNIRLGASKFNGVMVAPGETFSFNEHLGEVTLEEGYDESYVIIGNRTVPGVGGGICQVATTAFRAAFFGGYPIVERWPHAYRVRYYELGGYGPGFDATVYSPLVDFRFTNDTDHHLLIRTEVDAARARLRFLFYSTDIGREVEQVGPTWGEPIPPEQPVYEHNPDMPAGTAKLVERPRDGLTASLGRIVRDAEGTILYQDTFVSKFVPWPARYEYGPGYIPPDDAEVVTPEP